MQHGEFKSHIVTEGNSS